MPRGKKGKGKGKKTTKGKRAAASPAQQAARDAFAARNRGRKGPARSGAGGSMRAERSSGGQDTVIDKTPTRATPRALGPAFQMKIDAVPVIRTQPDDLLALGASLLFALRTAALGLLDAETAEANEILRKWFGDTAMMGILPRVDLSDEVRLWHEVFRLMPQIAASMSYSGIEWAQGWNAIAGAAAGKLSSAPPTMAGLDGLYPPVTGSVTTKFSVIDHPGVDIAAPAGTPVIAPEDLLITGLKYDAGGFGTHIVAVSRRPSDGTYPRIIGGGGTIESIMPAEGERKHLFGHLGTTAAGLKKGDTVERGAQIGVVGSTGRSTGPHLHWRVDLWIADGDGKIRLVPMDPADLVPLDVLDGSAAVRPPAASWTIEDPKSPHAAKDVAAYNVWVGGDIINRGGKISTGDIDILSSAVEPPPSEFDTYAKIGRGVLRGVGSTVGLIYGGPAGAKLGGAAGEGLARVGTAVVDEAIGSSGRA